MAGIKDYSTTQANNTDLNGINTAEGMLPSNLNNAIRALMKNTREWFNDSQWVEYGDGDAAFTAAYASATSFTIAGVNVTPIYHASRRIKLTATTPGTIYGTISSSSFSTNTTVNVTWDSGSLSSEAITNVYIGALSKTNSSIPTGIIGTTNIDDDAVTTAKIADGNITVAKMAVNSVDSDQYVDGSIDTAHIADSNITVAKMAANSVDSDQYVDGSIDTVHIGDDQITSAKIPDSAITSAKIADGAIVDADINASAAISLSKLENLTTARALVSDGSGDVSVSAVTSTEIGYLDGVSSAIQTQIDAKQASDADLTAIGALAKTDGNLIVGNGSTWVAESGATARTSLGLGTISTQASDNVSLTGGSITGLGEPSSNSDASTKSYVDQAVAGLRTRTIAECASTANVTISSALEAGDAIDGVTLVAGDRVLLKDQSTATENGLYIAVASGAGAASRDPEHDTIAELSGGMVVVNQGSVNDNKIFLCTTDSDGSLGSTSITYTVVTPSNSGTVTSIATGTGIDGGTITSTGTISIDSTVATLAGTQTLTNKTLTSPIVATPTISGSASSAGAIAFKEDTDNGTNSVTLKGAAATADVTVTLPAATDTLVGKATTDTLTNKTLTSPKINEDVAVTSTATELNLLDGSTAGTIANSKGVIYSAAGQVNATTLAIAGNAITSTATELNKLDGVGTLKQAGLETMWVPAVAMYPSTTGGSPDPETIELTADANRPVIKAIAFDKDTDEYAQFSVAFPKSWNEGTITFKPFFTANTTNTGTALFILKGITVSDNDAISTDFGAGQGTAKAHSGTAYDLNVGAESSAITIAGSPAVGDQTFFAIFRDVSGDTLTADALLTGIKIFYTTDAANDA